MRKTLIAASFVALAGTPALAFNFVCQVKDMAGGVISSVVAMSYDEGSDKALVFDGVIKAATDKPMAAKIKDRGNGKYRLTYRVNDIPTTTRKVDINYRIEIDTRTKAMTMRGLIPGVENSIIGKGQCETAKWKP